jgi:hypothetical protein
VRTTSGTQCDMRCAQMDVSGMSEVQLENVVARLKRIGTLRHKSMIRLLSFWVHEGRLVFITDVRIQRAETHGGCSYYARRTGQRGIVSQVVRAHDVGPPRRQHGAHPSVETVLCTAHRACVGAHGRAAGGVARFYLRLTTAMITPSTMV